jgi:hypothetical protein
MNKVSVRCKNCGAEIKYIPVPNGHIVTEADYTEIITDTGRIIQGHIRHKCGVNENTV